MRGEVRLGDRNPPLLFQRSEKKEKDPLVEVRYQEAGEKEPNQGTFRPQPGNKKDPEATPLDKGRQVEKSWLLGVLTTFPFSLLPANK